ncbi:MAG: tripeptidase T [Coriobacteriia bacterium]
MATPVVQTFLELVRIDSPTGSELGVARYAADRLAALGFDVRVDDTAEETGSNTGNVVATLPGTADGRSIAFSAHMDCVSPCEGVEPVIEEGSVRSAGDTVLGADDKAGIAAIIEGIAAVIEAGVPRPDVRVVLTVAEEAGLRGAKALAPDDCRADLCLVLDADGPVGGIVTAAPTHYTFIARFTGAAAHAGVEPEKGVSAIEMASAAICRMELGRLDAETTANIGTIRGGTATNVVAPTCVVTGECRSLDPERVEIVRASLDAALRGAADEAGGAVEVTWTLEYRGFRFADDADELAIVRSACRSIGVEPRTFATGGGSDGSIFAGHGVRTLVLSSGMTSVHSTDEQIPVEDIERLASLVGAVLVHAVR